MANPIRATRVIGPILCVAGTTVLPTPAVGTRWKVGWWFLYNPGALNMDCSFELGPSAAARLTVWKETNIPNLESRVRDYELVINPTDSFAVQVSLLDQLHLTIAAYVLQLP
jgi:hypothetical protein